MVQMYKRRGNAKIFEGKCNANRVRSLTRYRLENEVKEGKYWITEEERKCKLCLEEEETLEHV